MPLARTLDPFTSGPLDPNRWRPLALPMPDGTTWEYRDPAATVRADGGTLEIAVPRFHLRHDTIHMFDDPKHLLVSTEPVPVAAEGTTVVAVEMACQNHDGNADDLTDGFAFLMLGDFTTGMIFDVAISGTRVAAIYERLPIPGVTPEDGAFTYLVQNPFAVANAPRAFHRYEVRLDRAARACEWRVDGRRLFATRDLPVDVAALTVGVAIATLKPPVPGVGSVSCHGQGATGWWRPITVAYV